MIINRLVAIAVCTAMGFAVATQSEPAFAKNKNKNEQTTPVVNNGGADDSYPNGRPWQAMESDFDEVLYRLWKVKKDTETILVELDEVDADHVIIKNDLTEIKAMLDEIQNGLDDIGEGVSSLTNTLDVQVSVAPDEQRNDVSDTPVQLFVQVSQNGVGVTGLTAEDFSYSNSFPLNGAVYCGDTCFIAGANGLYSIELQGDWDAAPYAGTLSVQLKTINPGGDVTTGTSLVSFEIPALPVPTPVSAP
jgi:hypothetical protein